MGEGFFGKGNDGQGRGEKKFGREHALSISILGNLKYAVLRIRYLASKFKTHPFFT